VPVDSFKWGGDAMWNISGSGWLVLGPNPEGWQLSVRAKFVDIKVAVESAEKAMVIVNQAGRILVANREAGKLFNYAHGELLGKPIEFLLPDRFRRKHSGFRNSFFAHSAARQMGMGRIYGLRREGTEFAAEVRLSPIESDEGLLVACCIVEKCERSNGSAHEADSDATREPTAQTVAARAPE
jgi:PAS domain S-box-containing protein